jgi:hypothetical protein
MAAGNGDESGGQVSETAAAAGEQQAPGDSVAGHPSDVEDARTDSDSQGPDAIPREGRRLDQEDDDAGR